jgi:peptide deformylase
MSPDLSPDFSPGLSPELAARIPTERSLIQLGDPRLRQAAQAIPVVQAAWIQDLIDDLLLTLHQSQGVGIAAPQVAQPWQLVVVASHPNPRYPDAPLMEPTALINPRLIAQGGELVKGWEGCLSVPGIRGLVPRYPEIEVEYCDRQGKLRRQVWTGFIARIFQHEYDHLAGQVFLDRVESTMDLMTEQSYQASMGIYPS